MTLAERIAAARKPEPPKPGLPEWRKRDLAKIMDHGGKA